jgi:hypothetical protein
MLQITKLNEVPYSKETYLDEQSMYGLGLLSEDVVSNVVTRMHMSNYNNFSFIAMTQGVGLVKPVNTTHFKWFIDDVERTDIQAVELIGQSGTVGVGRVPFKFRATDNYAEKDHHLLCPDGHSMLRISAADVQADGTCIYTVVLVSGAPDSGLDASMFALGKYFTITFTSVPMADSDGNGFRAKGLARAYNQLSKERYSLPFKGNMANKVQRIEMAGDSLPQTIYTWIDAQRARFDLSCFSMMNDKLWFSEYNRGKAGKVALVDEMTGREIPLSAGIREQLYVNGNYTSHAGYITLETIKAVVLGQYIADNASYKINWTIQCGTGAKLMISQALEEAGYKRGYCDAIGQFRIQPVGPNEIGLTSMFTAYEFDGHVIRIVTDTVFDSGTMASNDKKNGRVMNGLPYCSYTAVVFDYGIDSSESNIFLVNENGRSIRQYIHRGTTDVPVSWGGAADLATPYVATTRERSSYEVISASAFVIKNASRCYLLELAA